MSTIDVREIIVEIVSHNGVYTDEEGRTDPQVAAVYQYGNMSGQPAWKIIYKDDSQELMEFITSPYVGKPIYRLWDRHQGLSMFGKKFLAGEM